MTALPTRANFGQAGVTEADNQAAMGALYDFLAGLFGSDGTAKTALATVGAIAHNAVKKSAAYTVVAGDRGKVFICEGTSWTLDLLAIATAGIGFPIIVWNRASGNVTLDGNGTEKIKYPGAADATNGDTTLVLTPGQSVLLVAMDEGAGVVYWVAPMYSGASSSSPPVNWAVDGELQSRRVGAAVNLSTAAQFGKAPLVSGWASAGAVSAGSLTMDTAATIGQRGRALHFSGVTLTGSAVLSARHRLHSSRARALKNKTVSFAVTVHHDVGSAVNFTLVVNKPTAADNWTSTTAIGTSTATSVPNATETVVRYDGVALGDVSNGLGLEVQAATGAVTTKNVRMTDFVIVEAATAGAWLREDRGEAEAELGAYYQSTFPDDTSPAQNAGLAGALEMVSTSVVGQVEWCFVERVLSIAGTLTTYNPSAANANWRDVTNGADRTFAAGDISSRRAVLTSTVLANARYAIHAVYDGRLAA